MKIIHYSSLLTRRAGGLYFSVSGLAKSLSALGHEVGVFGGVEKDCEDELSVWEGLPLTLHTSSLGAYGLRFSMLKEVFKASPDVFHLHGLWSAGTIYALIAKMRGATVIISPRGMLDPWIIKRRRAVKFLHAFFLERPLLRSSNVHALSHLERAAITAFDIKLAPRTFVSPNGIDGTTPNADSKSGFVYIGRIHPKKQVASLIDHWSGHPALVNWQLTIAGWGEEQHEESLRSKMSRVTIGGSDIRFVGPVYGSKKNALLSSSTFFILPSLSEGLPMAVLEALQFGCIPIITQSCNLPELFEAGVALRLEEDFSNFSSVIDLALSMTKEQLAEYSQRAIDISRNYLWENIAKQMEKEYFIACVANKG